ncbi:MAG: hypothetical protein ABIL06_13280 [Pseudomonadota bacterium]|uniref:Uncharacterized protein n=1 Tax=viral metagenome TaxID=1070528 RepID=A0A6H1ZHF2_9ZZZZ
MQILHVQETTKDGKKISKTIEVIRSWIDSSGKSIYHFADGKFGFKSGAYIRSLEDLDILKAEEVIGETPAGKPKTRPVESFAYAQAKRWWDAIGKAQSEEYYAKERMDLEARHLSGVPELPKEGTAALDGASYTRQPVEAIGRKNLTNPSHYGRWFGKDRPGWWGYADLIEMAGYRYRRVLVEDGEVYPLEEVPEAVNA